VRSLFLFLSRQKQLRRFMETSRLARRMAARFVAGDTLPEALAVSRRINSETILVTLDHLGENTSSLEEAAAYRDAYLLTLTEMVHAGIQGNVSLKLTQFGLDLSERACRANVEELVGRAAGLGNFVRVDMESSAYTDRTLAMVRDLHAAHGAVGAVIQAYLYRSRADIEDLARRQIRVRLCKGAYLEPPSVAFRRKSEVDRNFIALTQLLLDTAPYPAIATHDPRMIDAAREHAAKRGIPRAAFEFQMLYGIRRDLQRQLVKDGYRLRLYVPFGPAWYPYFMRRLAERPANMLFLARHLFR